MTCIIENTNGTFWNCHTDCFGPKQSATEYECYVDLPCFIKNDAEELALDGFYYHRDCTCEYDGGCDCNCNFDIVAKIVEVL